MTDGFLAENGAGDAAVEADPTAYLPGTRWRAWHVLAATAATLVTVSIGATVVLLAAGATDFDDLSANVRLGGLTAIQFVGGFVFLYWLARRHGHRRWRDAYGLAIGARDWWAVVAGIGLQMGLGLVTYLVVEILFPSVDVPQQSTVTLAQDVTGWGIALAVVAIVIAAPIYEEIVFRGILLSRTLRLMPPWAAYAVNGLAFGAIHLVDPDAWFAAILLVPVGAWLAWIAHRRGNLSPAILAHMGLNALALMFLFTDIDVAEVTDAIAAFLALH